jgi:hypothetical protein
LISTETRTLIPGLIFASLSLALILTQWRAMAPAVLLVHSITCWPDFVSFYCNEDAWRLQNVQWSPTQGEDLPIDGREQFNIESVRQWCKSSHVLDTDAASAFSEGRGIFDVDPEARRLIRFFKQHPELRQIRRDQVDFLSIDALPDHRRVYFAFRR